MERLRGPINSSLFFGEKMNSEEETLITTSSSALEMGFYPQMPSLQMLNEATKSEEETEQEQDAEEEELQLHLQYPPESNLQLLLRIQQGHSHHLTNPGPIRKIEPIPRPPDQLDNSESHSQRDTRGVGASKQSAIVGPREGKKRRKRSRPPPTKSAQDAESQRMTHIAVERNRRRLMNSYLDALRSLMPPSFIQRGDQASIIGGAIDFVKELEQLLLSLQAEKRIRTASDGTATSSSASSSTGCSTNASRSCDDEACHVAASLGDFFVSPQYTSYTQGGARDASGEVVGADVEATVVQGHVNLKVLSGRRRRRNGQQLVRVIATLEEFGLAILHLNITCLDQNYILYSLNLKMEEECKLGSADEIATAVHQIFSYISVCCD